MVCSWFAELMVNWGVALFCFGNTPPSMFEVFVKLPTPVRTGFLTTGFLESPPARGRLAGDPILIGAVVTKFVIAYGFGFGVIVKLFFGSLNRCNDVVAAETGRFSQSLRILAELPGGNVGKIVWSFRLDLSNRDDELVQIAQRCFYTPMPDPAKNFICNPLVCIEDRESIGE
jgi:hypothetical protein